MNNELNMAHQNLHSSQTPLHLLNSVSYSFLVTVVAVTLRYLIIIALFLMFFGKNSCATLFFLALFLLILPNLECATFIR